jgi:probable F420-dependent oxidoreductase
MGSKMSSTDTRRKAEFGVRVITLGAETPERWREVIAQAQAAERAGADRVVVSGDHVVFGERLDAYADPKVGGMPDRPLDIGPDAAFPDPVVSLAVVCAVTERVRVMNSLLLAALRRPIVLAKALATLDVVSGGRIDVSVGVGWQREEYGAAGLDFERRGRLLEHTLEVCQALWRDERAVYSSPELSFEAIHMHPKPLQPGGVPIWVSGTVNPGAMRRLARFGTGWVPWAADREDLLGAIPRMRDAVAALGRDPDDVQILAHMPLVPGSDGRPEIGPSIERVGKLVDAGVTNIDAFLPVPTEPDAAEDYLAEWVGAFRKATA